MRPTPWTDAESHRALDPLLGATSYGDDFGCFLIPHHPTRVTLRVIASSGTDEIPWEHVSVSLPNRCPNWPEMCFVKDIFWEPEECVVQFHPPRSEYRNFHQFCLHLWKHTGIAFPRPVPSTVAPSSEELAAVMDSFRRPT